MHTYIKYLIALLLFISIPLSTWAGLTGVPPTYTCPGSEWIDQLNGDSEPVCTQPASSDLSDASDVCLYSNGSKTWGSGTPFTWTFDSDVDSTFDFTDPGVTITSERVQIISTANTNLLKRTATTDESIVGTFVQVRGEAIGGSSVGLMGLDVSANQVGTSNGGGITGIRAASTNNGGGTFNTLTGALTTTQNTGDATWLISTSTDTTSSSGTVESSVGLMVWDNAISGGTTNNNYGIYINNQEGSGASNNWQLYSPGTAPSYLNGDLQLDNQADLKFYELDANGENYQALTAPASLAGDSTITFPDMSGTVALYEKGDATWGSGSPFTWTFDTNAGTDPTIGFNEGLTIATTHTTTATLNGLNAQATKSGNSNTTTMTGVLGQSIIDTGSGNISNVTALYGWAINSDGSGTIDWLTGVLGYADTAATGTIDNLVALSAIVQNDGATVNNAYGLLVDNADGVGTNSWAIKTGTGKVEFGDDLWLDNEGEIRLYEGTGGGTNYQALKAPATLGGDTTLALNIVPATCTGDGNGGALTVNGSNEIVCSADDGGGASVNSFETWDAPAGTDPVADSSTDTMTLTETAGIDITGTAASDSIEIAFDPTEVTLQNFAATTSSQLAGVLSDEVGTVGGFLRGGTKCFALYSVDAADDNKFLTAFDTNTTALNIWCSYEGSAPSTAANFAIDVAGTTMTLSATPTCAGPTSAATAVTCNSNCTMTAKTPVRFSVTNTPNPATDTYMLCISY